MIRYNAVCPVWIMVVWNWRQQAITETSFISVPSYIMNDT